MTKRFSKLNGRRAYVTLSPVSLLLLAACGGNGSSIVSPSSSGPINFSGHAIKGPLSNALVFLDYDNDGKLDLDEPSTRTAEDGSYNLTTGNENYTIVAITDSSTIDTSSGAVLSGIKLKASADASVVTPTTTLIEEAGITPEQVAEVLGLPDGIDPLQFNPYATDVDVEDALAVEQISQQLISVVNAFAGAARGSGATDAEAFEAALTSVVEVVKSKANKLSDDTATSAEKTLDLTNADDLALVKTIIASKVVEETSADITAFNAVADDIVIAVKNVNDKIGTVTDLSSDAAKNTFSTTQVLAEQANQAAAAEAEISGSGSIDFTDAEEVDTAANNQAPTALLLDNNIILDSTDNLIVGFVTTVDQDQPDGVDFIYSIEEIDGTDYNRFAIDPATGELSTVVQPGFEAKASYNIVVKVTDAGGKAYSKAFTLFPENAGPTGGVTIIGIAAQNETLIADTSALADADGLGELSYVWKAGDEIIIDATSDQYTLTAEEVGKEISVSVSYIDGSGVFEVLQSASTLEVTSGRAITGTARQGEILIAPTTSLGVAAGFDDFAFQWLSDGETIEGATIKEYKLTQDDVDKTITVLVTFLDRENNKQTVLSDETAAVENVNDAPIVTSTPVKSIYEDTAYSYTFEAVDADDKDGENGVKLEAVKIPSWLTFDTETGRLYGTPTNDDVGKHEVLLTAKDGAEAIVFDAFTLTVINTNSAPTGTVEIAGNATLDGILSVDTNQLSDSENPEGLNNFTYQWQADGELIVGATEDAYTLTKNEIGKIITVVVSYTDGEGSLETVVSASTDVVTGINDPVVGTPIIIGTARQGENLTADSSNLSDNDGIGDFSYQWLADGVIIDGAIDSEFTLTQEEVDTQITVDISYIDGAGNAESVSSIATNAVLDVNDEPSGTVSIEGSPLQTEALTVTNNIVDPDGVGPLSYVWKADDEIITAAVTDSYTLTQAEVGKAIVVEVNYTDHQGNPESISSDPTETVVNVNDEPTGSVIVLGNVASGESLSAFTLGLRDADGLGELSYQWTSDNEDILDETDSIYVVKDTDVGNDIKVVVSYTDGGGKFESVLGTQLSIIQASTSNRGMDGSLTDRDPQIAVVRGQDGDETVALTWQGETSDDQVFDIFASIIGENAISMRLEDRPDGFVDQTPQITALGSGGFAIAWQSVSELNSSISDIYVQKFDVDGSSAPAQKLQGFSMVGGIPREDAKGDFTLSKTGNLTFDEKYDRVIGMMPDETPVICALETGFVVAWSGLTTDDHGNEIFIQRFNNDGTKNGDITRIFGMEGELSDTTPQIKALENGFVVTWSGETADGEGYDIFLQRFENSGEKVGDIIRLSGMSGQLLDAQPDVVSLPNGEFAISWRGDTSDGSDWDIFVQKFDKNGNPEGNEVRLNGMSGELKDFSPQLGALADGTFMVVWQGWTSDGQSFDIFAQKFTDKGEREGDTIRINGMDGELADWYPKVVSNNEGGAFIIWSGETFNGQNTDIFIQTIDNNGGAIQKVQLQGNSGDFLDWAPQASILSDNLLAVSWHGETSVEQGIDIFTQYFVYEDDFLVPIDIV